MEKVRDVVANFMEKIRNNGADDLIYKSQQLAQLNVFSEQLAALHEEVSKFVEKESSALMEYIKNVENNLCSTKHKLKNTSQTNSDNFHSDISRLPPESRLLTWVDAVKIAPPPGFGELQPEKQNKQKQISNPVQPPQLQCKREIAENVFIDAYTIKTPQECHNFKGYWCYIVNYNRFYISINDEILEAITTNILPPDITPYKCIEHRYAKGNTKIDWENSKFYVPRIFDPKSRDVRQFTARMKFVSASKEIKENEPYTIRIGSRDTLPQDMKHATEEEIRLFNDYVGNFILMFTAVSKYVNSNQSK